MTFNAPKCRPNFNSTRRQTGAIERFLFFKKAKYLQIKFTPRLRRRFSPRYRRYSAPRRRSPSDGALRGCVVAVACADKRRFNASTCTANTRQCWHSPLATPPPTASFIRCISCAFFNLIVFSCSPMTAYCTLSRASSTTHKLNT